MRFDSTSTASKFVRSLVRGKRGYIAAAIAGAALFGASAIQTVEAGTYNYVFVAGTGTTNDWTNTAAWTLGSGTASATNYPGGDPTEVDDAVANFVSNTTAAGVNNITLSNPLANSLGNLTLEVETITSTDQLNFAVNANLTIAGAVTLQAGSTGSSNRGLVTMTTAAGTNLNVNGTMTLASANGNGSANTLGFAFVTINGNAALGGLTIKDDADEFVVSATAGNVNLGNVSLGRTLNNATVTSASGLHLLGGNVTANNFLIGSADSSASVVVAGSNLTVNGSFIIGDNGTASPRVSILFQTAGNVTASNSTLFLGSSAVGTVGAYQLGNGTNNVSLTVAGMQMTNVGGSANNKANFTMANGTLLNVGASGIGTGSGTYTFTNNGGTIAATASFASTANMAISSNTVFQAADGAANPFNITWSGAISGGGNITKTGGGNLTLSGANTYSGTTTVSAGRLIVNNTAAGSSGTGTGAVAINSASLAGTGTISGAVTVSSGSHIAPGVNSVGTLNFGGNLTVADGAVLDFDFNPSANSLINVTNSAATFTLGAAGINLFAEGTTNAWETNGTYNLIQVAGSVPSITGLSILNGMAGVTYTLGTTAHDITVTISGGTGALGWAHDISGSWGNAANWNGGIPAGSLAVLGNVLTAPRTVTLDGDRSVTGISLNSASGYTIAQGTGGNLTLDNGASTAAITDFAGPHVISAPVILNSNTTVSTTNPTDTLTLSGAIGGVGSLSVSGSGTVILANGANTFSGGITSTGNIQVGSGAAVGSLGAGSVTNTGVLTFNSSSNMAISTVITGSGNVVQNGTGVLTLSGANTYSGATVINNGIVRYGTTTGLSSGNVNIASGAKLDLNGLAVTLINASGTGSIDNMLVASNATLTFNGANPSFGGTIQNTGGSLAVVSAVSGRTTLSGNSTYSGGTSVTTGLLQVNSNNALGTGNVTLTSTTANTLQLGSGVVLSNPIIINDGSIEFADVATGGTSATFAGPITTVGSTQYRLGNSNTTSTLIMTGPSTVNTGITLLTRGVVMFEGSGSLIVSNNSVAIGRSGSTATMNLTMQDNSVIRGVGIQLGGLNSTSDDGTTTVILQGNALLDAGTSAFSLNNSDDSGGVTLTMNDNSTVRGASFAITGSKVGQANVVFNSGNIVATASSANFFPNSSHTTFELDGPMTINDGGFNIGIGQNISADFGSGTITKTGTGTVTLSGTNFYGDTTVTSGTLLAVGGSALGSGNVTVNAGASFGGTGTVSNAVFMSGHLAPGAGATVGTLTLSGTLTLNSGSTLDINFLADGSANSQLDLLSGTLSGLAGLNLYVAGTTNPFDLNGNYTLGTFADPSFTAASVLNGVAGATYTFTNVGGTEFLQISGGVVSAAWAVDANGAWTSSGSWTGGVPNQVGAVANFGSVITAPRTVTVSGTQTVGIMNFNNANAYTVTGGTIVLDNGANGPAVITDTLGNHTIASAVTLNSNASLNVATGNSLTLSGAVGGAGGLTAGGAGIVVLSGANTYSGGTTISAGTVQLAGSGTLGSTSNALSIASGATLDMNGASATVGSLSGAGTIDNVANAGASVLTAGGLNSNTTFSGVIKNTTGTVALNKVGTGTMTLSGTNTYSGGVTLTGGDLSVGAAANLGAAANPIKFNGGVLQVTGTTLTTLANPVTWSAAGGGFDIASSGNTFTVSAALSGGGLIKRGPGSLVVSGQYNTTSATTLTTGNLTLSAGGNTSGLISGGGNLTVSGGTKAAPGLVAAGIQTNAVTITGAAQLGSGSATSVVTSYTLGGAAGAWTGSLDLNGNKLAVEDATTHATTLANLRDQVQFGKANAFGISSTGLPASFGIAVLDNAILGKTTFGGATVDANAVLVAPEVLGDSNADGAVDLTDLSTVLNNFGSTTAAWTSGNFDGGPTIDLTDLSDVLNNFGATNPNASADAIGVAVATPEPGTLAVLAMGAMAVMAKRRRSGGGR